MPLRDWRESSQLSHANWVSSGDQAPPAQATLNVGSSIGSSL